MSGYGRKYNTRKRKYQSMKGSAKVKAVLASKKARYDASRLATIGTNMPAKMSSGGTVAKKYRCKLKFNCSYNQSTGTPGFGVLRFNANNPLIPDAQNVGFRCPGLTSLGLIYSYWKCYGSTIQIKGQSYDAANPHLVSINSTDSPVTPTIGSVTGAGSGYTHPWSELDQTKTRGLFLYSELHRLWSKGYTTKECNVTDLDESGFFGSTASSSEGELSPTQLWYWYVCYQPITTAAAKLLLDITITFDVEFSDPMTA